MSSDAETGDLNEELTKLTEKEGNYLSLCSKEELLAQLREKTLNQKKYIQNILRQERLLAPRMVKISTHLATPLRPAKYHNPPSNSNTSDHVIAPVRLCKWDNFKPDVNSWLSEQSLDTEIEEPPFIPRTISRVMNTLHPFINDNLLKYVRPCLDPSAEFGDYMFIPDVVGQPDFIIVRNGKLVSVIEVRGRWIFDDDPAFSSAVRQLYQYMRLNHVKYGCLTSYDLTSFFKREILGDEELLYVTDSIKFDDTNPTVLQSFAYFNTYILCTTDTRIQLLP
jgi:hypothetical protein